jgi:hypothetical protein
MQHINSLFGWLVSDGWEKSAGGWFVVREKYCWLVADKPSDQGVGLLFLPYLSKGHGINI